MNIGIPERNFFTFILAVLTGLLLTSCNQSDSEFTIGEDFIESATSIKIIDTFTVEMSTVIQDSVPTSGTGTMLIGNYRDTLFGNTTCNAFFQIGLPESINLTENDIYDSISLILYYSGYYYGDTNSRGQMRVHQLKEPIELHDDGYLYNTSTVDYEADAMGSIQFWPSPNRTDTIEIRIKDDIGLDLFNKHVERSDVIRSLSDFLDYFNGIAILANESMNNSIIGFNAAEESLKIRLYTHRVGQTNVENQYDFPLVNSDYQFNQIRYDFNQTLLHYADNEKTSIPSEKAGDKAFVQGYKKIMTKILFPTLPEILLHERGIIMKAELIFQPGKSSYADFHLPDFVILYKTNHNNRPGDLIFNSDGSVQTAELVLDELYNEETSYTFNVTDFINEELSDAYFDTENGLLVSLYNSTYQLNLERIVIDTKKPAPRLKIYYLSY